MDGLGYDCYLDSWCTDDGEWRKGMPDDAPALYRITGDCLTSEPRIRLMGQYRLRFQEVR